MMRHAPTPTPTRTPTRLHAHTPPCPTDTAVAAPPRPPSPKLLTGSSLRSPSAAATASLELAISADTDPAPVKGTPASSSSRWSWPPSPCGFGGVGEGEGEAKGRAKAVERRTVRHGGQLVAEGCGQGPGQGADPAGRHRTCAGATAILVQAAGHSWHFRLPRSIISPTACCLGPRGPKPHNAGAPPPPPQVPGQGCACHPRSRTHLSAPQRQPHHRACLPCLHGKVPQCHGAGGQGQSFVVAAPQLAHALRPCTWSSQGRCVSRGGQHVEPSARQSGSGRVVKGALYAIVLGQLTQQYNRCVAPTVPYESLGTSRPDLKQVIEIIFDIIS